MRGSHPSRETLSEYHDGELAATARVSVRRHVVECSLCQDYLADLQSGSQLYQRLPAVRPPPSLRHDMDRRIDSVEEVRRRRWLPIPTGGALTMPNLLGLSVVAVLLVVLLPHVVGAWSAFALRSWPSQSAAQPALGPTDGASARAETPRGESLPGEVPTGGALPEAPLVEPRVTVVAPTSVPPTATTPPAAPTSVPAAQSAASPTRAAPVATRTAAAPAATATTRTSTAAAGSTPAGGRPVGAPAATGTPVTPPGGPPASAPSATGTPVTRADAAPVPAASSPTGPTATGTAVGPRPDATRVVSGQISAVDRRQRLFSVFAPDSDGPGGGPRTWQVRLAESTRIALKDGRALTFEDVGIADQVEVAGAEASQSPGTLTAATVKVLVSAVATAANKPARVLVLLDGADALRPPQFGFTGDWIKRLNDTGYAVTPLEPARISSGRYDLKEFNLIVIGYPATLSPSALEAVKASRIPILNAEPRLVQALGLGHNVDPQQPMRDVPGKSVDIAGQASPVTGGAGGENVLAHDTLHRTPIVAGGAVLGTVNDSGQRRTVWSVTGKTMYFGFWSSAGGQNHNVTYWALFDRSVLWLLGRDPTTVPLPGS